MKKTIVSIAFLLTLMLATPTVAPTITQSATESTWVMMRGEVKFYGADDAFGWCAAFGEIGKWAQAFVVWIPWGGPSIPEIFRFYAARLVNTTAVELNHDGADLYIEGSWNVYNVTFIYEPGLKPRNYTLKIELLVDHGNGNLSVTGTWQDFALNITGPPSIPLVSGKVVFYAIRSFEIPIGDVSSQETGKPDGTTDIFDLVHAAKAYDSTPGMSNYDFTMDFNFDYKIDIYDLTTIAVNIGKRY